MIERREEQVLAEGLVATARVAVGQYWSLARWVDRCGAPLEMDEVLVSDRVLALEGTPMAIDRSGRGTPNR